MYMTQQNTKVLRLISLSFLFLLNIELYAREYKNTRYCNNEYLTVYKNNKQLLKIDNYLITESKFGFVGCNEGKYFCYIKDANIFIDGIDWAFTNNYGIALKFHNHFKIYFTANNFIKVKTEADYVIPLADRNLSFMSVDNAFNVKNIIKLNDEYFEINGNIQCYDGGVIYINDEKNVEILNTRNEILKTNYPWYLASNKYLWLYDDNELILKDDSFMTIFNIEGKYEPLTVFVDGECVVKNDSMLFIFNSITKKMKEIRDYKICHS